MDPQLLWFVSRATGVVTLTVFTAVMVLGMMTAGRGGTTAVAGLSRAVVLRLHRYLSLLALVFLVAHIATAILDGYVDIGLTDVLVPFVAGYAPFWVGLGTLVLDLGIAVAVTSLLRTRLPRRVWKGVHLLAYAMWPVAILHSLFTSGGDAGSTWMTVTVVGCAVAVLIAAGFRLRPDRHPDTLARRRGDVAHDPAVMGPVTDGPISDRPVRMQETVR